VYKGIKTRNNRPQVKNEKNSY